MFISFALFEYKKQGTVWRTRPDQNVWWMTSPQQDAWEQDNCGRWRLWQEPLCTGLPSFYWIALSVALQGWYVSGWVCHVRCVCVQNGENCAKCKCVILFQTWETTAECTKCSNSLWKCCCDKEDSFHVDCFFEGRNFSLWICSMAWNGEFSVLRTSLVNVQWNVVHRKIPEKWQMVGCSITATRLDTRHCAFVSFGRAKTSLCYCNLPTVLTCHRVTSGCSPNLTKR